MITVCASSWGGLLDYSGAYLLHNYVENLFQTDVSICHSCYRTAVTCIGAIYEKLGRMVNLFL